MARASIAAVLAWGLFVFYAETTSAQPPVWSVPGYGIYPGAMTGPVGPSGRIPLAPSTGAALKAEYQAPLARVVRNSDETSGLPPYALADNFGAIQRYVEPVPGVDLEPYVGTVVRVRHDTGRTLLASQLELPPAPIGPLVDSLNGDDVHDAPVDVTEPVKIVAAPVKQSADIRPAEFVDHDDGSVQLLADAEETLPDGGEVAVPPAVNATIEVGPMNAESSYPMDSGGMPMEGSQMYGEPMEMSGGPMGMGHPTMDVGMPGMEMEYGEGMEGAMEVCPHCGGHTRRPGFEGMQGAFGPACHCEHAKVRWFADVQFNFLRAHVMENFAGKLSEKYEFSPRVIVGFEGASAIDGRARYWHYGRNSQILDGGGTIRIDFDVVDLEATRTVPFKNSALQVAAGLRSANIDLGDDDGDSAGCDLLGVTMAADFGTLLCRAKHGAFVGACGARLSILGGDWGRQAGNDFIPSRLQDDNWLVDELYAGVAYETCYRKVDLHALLGFEIQNWHSDVLSQFAGADSISFLGPGIEIGAEF